MHDNILYISFFVCMYVFAKHVHKSYITYTCFGDQLKGMTTYVYVMYVLDKHVHALNLFFISIFMVDFCLHVRFCRLILKKKSPCEKNIFSWISYHTVTLPEYQLIMRDRNMFFLSRSYHTYIALWRQCDRRKAFLSRITCWFTISMTVWQKKRIFFL